MRWFKKIHLTHPKRFGWFFGKYRRSKVPTLFPYIDKGDISFILNQ